MTKKQLLITISLILFSQLLFNVPVLAIILLWFFSGAFFFWVAEKDCFDLETVFMSFVMSICGPFVYFIVRNEFSFERNWKELGFSAVKFQSPIVFEKEEE